MPNIITHGLFAKNVFDHLQDETLIETIKKNPREFIIGSNGPDFFFFYKIFNSKANDIRKVGNLVHSLKINDFFLNTFEIIEKEEDNELKEAMTSYIIGHLCHWALDSCTHPYVFYKTGAYTKISESMHHRFESMIDTILLKNIKNESIKTFKFYLLTKQSKNTLDVISKIYIPTVKKLYDVEITRKHIKDALKDWYQISSFIHDPYKSKIKLLKLYEKIKNSPWLYSGNVIPVDIDETYDVLNTKKETWCYPTDKEKKSNESFMEIYERASVMVLDILHHINDKDYMLSHINNASYDTGESEIKELMYFDYIYGGENESI